MCYRSRVGHDRGQGQRIDKNKCIILKMQYGFFFVVFFWNESLTLKEYVHG